MGNIDNTGRRCDNDSNRREMSSGGKPSFCFHGRRRLLHHHLSILFLLLLSEFRGESSVGGIPVIIIIHRLRCWPRWGRHSWHWGRLLTCWVVMKYLNFCFSTSWVVFYYYLLVLTTIGTTGGYFDRNAHLSVLSLLFDYPSFSMSENCPMVPLGTWAHSRLEGFPDNDHG